MGILFKDMLLIFPESKVLESESEYSVKLKNELFKFPSVRRAELGAFPEEWVGSSKFWRGTGFFLRIRDFIPTLWWFLERDSVPDD